MPNHDGQLIQKPTRVAFRALCKNNTEKQCGDIYFLAMDIGKAEQFLTVTMEWQRDGAEWVCDTCSKEKK